jgi:hypothetical protein
LLFLKGGFTEANEVFGEAKKREMSVVDARQVEFRPYDRQDLTKRVRFQGKISAVAVNSVLISVVGYPRVFRRGAKLGDRVLQLDTEVSFDVAFNGSGPVAENLALLNG